MCYQQSTRQFNYETRVFVSTAYVRFSDFLHEHSHFVRHYGFFFSGYTFIMT